MMYSDVGHGLMLLAVSKALNLSTIWLVMSCMSIYFGLLFNEFYGMKIALIYKLTGGIFGVDPIWGVAHNSLAF
jgi:vacuolar-type H+-ATPase subunit I/STV1